MTDTTLNRYLSSGTAAERGAFTPDPATPASGPDPTYVWFETDTGLLYAWDFDGSTWELITGSGGDVVGPASAVTARIATFNGTSGKIIQDGGVTIAGLAGSNNIGYLGSPILTSLDSGNVAPALGDEGKTFLHTDANPRNFTIPANASIAFAVGTILAIENEDGAADITISITSDTLRWTDQTGPRTLTENGGCSIQKVASTVWRLRGEGIT